MLETLLSSTLFQTDAQSGLGLETCLATPSLLISAFLAKHWSSWKCFGVIMVLESCPGCGPLCEEKGSSSMLAFMVPSVNCSSSVLAALPHSQTNNFPNTTRFNCGKDTLVFVLLAWLQHHNLVAIQTK